MKILITGVAGFVGFHLSKKLLDESYQVIGSDNLNDYYDPSLKQSRLEILGKYNNFTFQKKASVPGTNLLTYFFVVVSMATAFKNVSICYFKNSSLTRD